MKTATTTELITPKARRALSTRGLDISKPADFAKFARTAKLLQDMIDAAWDEVENQMTERGIKKIDGDWGYATIAERKNWKAAGTLPPRFYKQSLDTRKLAFALDEGKLPAGVSFSTTKYLTKRVK